MDKNKLSKLIFALCLALAVVLSPALSLERLALSEMSPEQEKVRVSLEEYYFAFIGEKMDEYLSTQILAHLTESELAEKKSRIESIWASFDSGFAIDTYNSIATEEDVAIVEYVLNSFVKDSEGAQERAETEYTAILFKTKEGWKVFSATPRAFSNFEVLFENLNDAKEGADLYEKLDPSREETLQEPPKLVTTTTTTTTTTLIENKTVPVSCSPDPSFLSNFSVSLGGNAETVKAIIGDNKTLSISVGNASFLARIEGDSAKSVSLGTADFKVSIDPCAYERISLGGNPKKEYDEGNIKISASSFGDSFKLVLAKVFNFFYTLFNRNPFELWLEAEEGTLSGNTRYSFIGPTSRGPGELYLGDKGTTARYSFKSGYSGKVHIYLRVSDDGLHPDGARSVDFALNGKELKYPHKSIAYYPWGMEYLGEGELVKGENSLSIAKPAQTSAAFTLDKMLFSEKKI